MTFDGTKHNFKDWNIGGVDVDLKVNEDGDVEGLNSLEIGPAGERNFPGMSFTIYKDGKGLQLWYKASQNEPHSIEFDRLCGEFGAKIDGDTSDITAEIKAPHKLDISSFMIDVLNMDADINALRRSLWQPEQGSSK